jgi:hypothetical protein
MFIRLTMFSSDQTKRRIPEEKGPFGKARKRGLSRSKTGTPARKEDQAKLDDLRVIDSIFAQRPRKPSGPSASLPISASAPNLIDAGGLGTSFQGSASVNAALKEPAEVILYGFGTDVQWAAIEFFERISGGIIFEEYDRQPPNARYNLSLSHSQQKYASIRSLGTASLRKINEYVGGEHWIKVTFDSPEAAEQAIHYSPKVIQGFEVKVERYRGVGPSEDRAVRAGEQSRVTSLAASPNNTTSSTTLFANSSTTLSSATVIGSRPSTMPPRIASEPFFRASGAFPVDEEDDLTIVPVQQVQVPTTVQTTSAQLRGPSRTALRIRGAKPLVLLPQEKAFKPAASRWQHTLGSWPVIGWIVGSNQGIIGDQVPRKEDGTFDEKNASLYWKSWHAVDTCFGTDFCGVKDAEYDE